jgi:hypothetical protein
MPCIAYGPVSSSGTILLPGGVSANAARVIVMSSGVTTM